MDDYEPRKTATTNKRTAAAIARTPSPSRRRRRRLLTGSSPGCVPRPTGASASYGSASGSSSSTTTTPSRALRTPPPRRLLPPSSASAKRQSNHLTPPPRVARSSATSVLRLDDVEVEDGDDAFSIISGDGSPERDRHVMEFLSYNSLPDGTPAFTLFTPSPAASKTSGATRSIHSELTAGLLTPQASPQRTQKDVASPSLFLRSPYASNRGSNSSTNSSPLQFLGRRDKTVDSSTEEENEDEGVNESDLEPEPRRSVTRSTRTPRQVRDTPSDLAIKLEAVADAIACKLPDGLRSSSSTPSSTDSASGAWRRNSLSLMLTPSPAPSANAKTGRARAQLLRSAGRDPFAAADEDELTSAPSAFQGGNDQDWLFSFANTLSPLAHGGASDEDLETSFLSLRFSPASTSSIDLQRLLPPFPSPGSALQDSVLQTSPAPPMTPEQATETKSSASSPSSLRTARPLSASRSSGSSSSSSSRELSESFPNIRASTTATPGRNERLKVSSSSVMKMKLHVSFDEFPLSHSKREIEAINNSLKRKKHARKRKLDESKQRQQKINSKGLNVQRKLLHTPVKEEQQEASNESKTEVETEIASSKPKHAKKSLYGRTAQRKLLVSTDDTMEDSQDAAHASSVKVRDQVSTGSTREKATAADAATVETASSSLRRRLSPTFGSVSTQTLPSTLTSGVQTPNLHPLKLRKSPPVAKTVVAQPVASRAIEKSVPTPSSEPLPKPQPVVPVKDMTSIGVDTSQPKLAQPVISSVTSQLVKPATPLQTPSVKPQPAASTTPLPMSTAGFAASAQILRTPAPQSVSSVAVATATPGAAGNQKKVHCNCKKSKCLKLYCECFANGEHCDELCNCVGCCNTPAHEDVRQQAITSRLEKNPNAFKPKIELTVVTMASSGVTPSRTIPGFLTPHNDHHQHHARHHHHHHTLAHGKGDLSGDLKKMHKHGCHCKKSGCQKRYCECFQAGVPCGENCRCIDCKNHSPYAVKNATVTTPLISARGSSARGPLGVPAAVATPDANGDTFVSPTLQSVRQRLRIDRETWARNFSSPFEVSPRRERERTERLRAQLKSSRASALLRSFNTTSAAVIPAASTPEVVIKTEPSVAATTATPSALSLRVNSASSFASPPGHVLAHGVPKPTHSLSPLSDATRPAPPSTPYGKDAHNQHGKRFAPYNPHALEALAINRETPGRVYVLPLFGDELPPVKTDVSAKIFHFLTNADVYNASLVNRLWSRVTTGDAVWDHHNFRRVAQQHLLATADVSSQPDDGDVAMQA